MYTYMRLRTPTRARAWIRAMSVNQCERSHTHAYRDTYLYNKVGISATCTIQKSTLILCNVNAAVDQVCSYICGVPEPKPKPQSKHRFPEMPMTGVHPSITRVTALLIARNNPNPHLITPVRHWYIDCGPISGLLSLKHFRRRPTHNCCVSR